MKWPSGFKSLGNSFEPNVLGTEGSVGSPGAEGRSKGDAIDCECGRDIDTFGRLVGGPGVIGK